VGEIGRDKALVSTLGAGAQTAPIRARMPPMRDPREALEYALDKYPERVEAIPIEELVLDSARKNDKRPAYVQLAVPDEIVQQIRKKRPDGDLVLLVRVPKEILERSESLIVLPGEVR
jgi:hypothetical protein